MSVHSTIVERKISNNDTELTVHLSSGLMTIQHDPTGFDAELIDRLIIDLQMFKSEYDTEISGQETKNSRDTPIQDYSRFAGTILR